MRREEGRRNSEYRIQKTECGMQDLGVGMQKGIRHLGRWVALLGVVLAGGCATPPVALFTDAEWVSHATTGRGCHERGDYRRGAEAYGRAQERARALDDADALAVSAVNRAMCLVADGRAGEALGGLEEALADARVSESRRTEVLVALARAEEAQGRVEEALARAGEALKREPEPAQAAQAALAKAGAELIRGDPAAAGAALGEGLGAKDWERLPEALRAERAALRGRIAAAEGKPSEALARQDEAAMLWKKAGRLPEMARALAEGGRQAQAAGEGAGACDRFHRAARSLWAQGRQAEAVRVLEEGVEAAERLGNEGVAKKMAELFVTFKEGQRLEQ